jgi:hypothetical protein
VSPFRFTGRIAQVVVETGEGAGVDAEAQVRTAFSDQ